MALEDVTASAARSSSASRSSSRSSAVGSTGASSSISHWATRVGRPSSSIRGDLHQALADVERRALAVEETRDAAAAHEADRLELLDGRLHGVEAVRRQLECADRLDAGDEEDEPARQVALLALVLGAARDRTARCSRRAASPRPPKMRTTRWPRPAPAAARGRSCSTASARPRSTRTRSAVRWTSRSPAHAA